MPLTHLFLALLFLQAPKPGSISGIVTNSVTGAPVRKALVTLQGIRGAGTYTATADPSGRFVVEGVKPGAYYPRAECIGFRYLANPSPISVAEEQSVQNVALQMTPNGVITGKVLDENGEPMTQMRVNAAASSFSRGGRTMTVMGMALTDDRGEYRIFDLPAGRYYLMVINPALGDMAYGRLHTDAVETAYVTTWFPGVADASQAASNELAPGAEISGMDFRLRKVRVFHIRGKAVAPGGGQRPDGVEFHPCGAFVPLQLSAHILRDGSFDAAGIQAGTWCAAIDQMVDESHGFSAHQTVTVTDHDVSGVILTVTPNAEIRGQVLVDGAPSGKTQFGPVRLQPETDPGREIGARVEADGSFKLGNVKPQIYRVSGFAPGLYLKAVLFNGQNMPEGQIEAPPGGGQLKLLFATDSGELSGTAPGAGISVTATSSTSLSGSVATAFTNDGNFRMIGLAPGDYQVLAWETRDSGLLEYSEFRKLFQSRAVSVTVHSSGHETVSLQPVAAAEIEAAKARLP